MQKCENSLSHREARDKSSKHEKYCLFHTEVSQPIRTRIIVDAKKNRCCAKSAYWPSRSTTRRSMVGGLKVRCIRTKEDRCRHNSGYWTGACFRCSAYVQHKRTVFPLS